MNSLESEQVARTLSKLHNQAEVSDRDLMAQVMADVAASGESLESRITKMVAEEKRTYPAVYREHADRFLAVSPDYGRFLYGIVRARNASRIVEFGTSMGVSTIYLAAALRDNGGGTLIGSELEPGKVGRARTTSKKPVSPIWLNCGKVMPCKHSERLEMVSTCCLSTALGRFIYRY